MEKALKKHLEISYDELEILNLQAKSRASEVKDPQELQNYYCDYLRKEERLKAVSLCFCDIEGRFHMLDYDKKYLLSSNHYLTFDGSSIRGFSNVGNSDLRISPDWSSFRWLPADVFGPGKVIMFADIKDKDDQLYLADTRSRLKAFSQELYDKEGMTTNVAVECEGFLFAGLEAEQNYDAAKGFQLVSVGGYFNSLPRNPLKLFIDAFADAQRALGFENEKDHPEVAPSQFELNYKYTNAVWAGDQLLLYKLVARQIAANMGMTASFLPKPVAGINGSGMHCNISLSKDRKNIFFDKNEKDQISTLAQQFIDRILFSANDLSLLLNPSVNAFRRQDPAFEAPNQIKASAHDRTSMIRVPLANESSARIEVRTVAPDANPYLVFYALLKTGMNGPLEESSEQTKRARTRILPGNIQDAMRHFKNSDFISELVGEDFKEKFHNLKRQAADRCPKELGKFVKKEEIIFHHEVTNQFLWSQF